MGTFSDERFMRCVPQPETAAEFARTIPKNIGRDAKGRRRGRPNRPGGSGFESQDLPALEELFLSSRERFIGVAYGVLGNREDAEDAVQDAFLSACRHFESFEGRCALTTWFTRIVINAALMMGRKRKNNTVSSSQTAVGDTENSINEIPDRQASPEKIYATAEIHAILKTLLADIKPMLRQVLTMTYYDGLSVSEGSSRLRVPVSTYKARLFRARHLLEEKARRFCVTRFPEKIAHHLSHESETEFSSRSAPADAIEERSYHQRLKFVA